MIKEIEYNGIKFVVNDEGKVEGRQVWHFRCVGNSLVIDNRDRSFGYSFTKRRAWDRIRAIADEIVVRHNEHKAKFPHLYN